MAVPRDCQRGPKMVYWKAAQGTVPATGSNTRISLATLTASATVCIPHVGGSMVSPAHPWKCPSARCLFCQAEACDTDTNLGHMRKAHGLLIPATDRLIVDVGTLLGYLHVVIFDLKECILCHTARRTASAVQQHMTGKGHCRIDLESENAEMLEFYEADNELARSRQCIAETHESPEMQVIRPSIK
ncbi:C2H2 type zinc-finger-domain-containing protein [Microdochium trichocladiopsis]|uniref:C2H2 type zinc-finger-domain-containing protein n=1 Tax=Microdochium trichocladiopsis TaxID=1682393 RepID=A0A9P8Y475_9PEZI|nr:C2H2 type zinc-finger-domain-containing protein [Microdochium trichocladiopsis]KAH7029267.1 C2H2 type zinc-finger-domain-containing protein [Microdochium trichocladiopsis]